MHGSDSRITSLVRWRTGLALAALLFPLVLYLVFERQARRLDALALHGEPVEAQVTAVSGDHSNTYYAYRVNDSEYTWSVARAEAPFAVGQTFPATYLPEDPSLSRPIADRGLAAGEATRNRSFARKTCCGAGLFLLAFAGLAHRDLRRLRAGSASEAHDPQGYKRRLGFTALAILPLLLLIGGFHFQDAIERGESVAPVLVAVGLCVLLVGGIFVVAGRDGPAKARERSAQILRWVAPIAGAMALLRLVVFLLGR